MVVVSDSRVGLPAFASEVPMKTIELIVDQQIRRWELERHRPAEAEKTPLKPGPIITISRQRGSEGSLVAEKLAELTGFSHFNREIIDQISHEIGTQKRLIESLDESAMSNFKLWVAGMLKGRIVDSSDYMQSLVKVIGAISHHGKAIIVGRGANFIIGGSAGFHIRIVADIDFRINSLAKRRNYTTEQAKQEIMENDRQRAKFIKNHFDRDIDDPSGYDLIINSTYLGVDDTAGLILGGFPRKLNRVQSI
jgi:cytidylate kinase